MRLASLVTYFKSQRYGLKRVICQLEFNVLGVYTFYALETSAITTGLTEAAVLVAVHISLHLFSADLGNGKSDS